MMFLFGRRKPKVKRKAVQDGVRFDIEYYNHQAPGRYKAELLEKITDSGICLAVINTDNMYKEQNIAYNGKQDEILSLLNRISIAHRKVTVKRKKETKIFGMAMNQDGKTCEELVIGLAAGFEDFKEMKTIMDTYNVHYFIDDRNKQADTLLDIFQSSGGDEEKLRTACRYIVFDDSFVRHICILCSQEDADRIGCILDELS